jgi:hypothetical protein
MPRGESEGLKRALAVTDALIIFLPLVDELGRSVRRLKRKALIKIKTETISSSPAR